VNRENVMMIQTPQTFNAALLLKAFEQAYQPAFTDEANVLEASGTEVYLIDGEYENIKITRPLDLAIAEYILAKRASKD
jgi:2-C-methyl-D-erythritol 4-phosphate cytidylyltransferase